MKHLSTLILLLSLLFTSVSCVEEEEYANTPTGNFEALWKIMDEHYCFFDLKKKRTLILMQIRVSSRFATNSQVRLH